MEYYYGINSIILSDYEKFSLIKRNNDGRNGWQYHNRYDTCFIVYYQVEYDSSYKNVLDMTKRIIEIL